jgi:hypothetical protein
MSINQKEFVEELKIEWKRLWNERHDDKVRAEGVAVNDYDHLFVDKGTVIHATRDFKALNFREILEEYQVMNPERYIPPNPQVGGWTKFVKTNYAGQKLQSKSSDENYPEEKKEKRHLKKSGRGWLHI